MQRIITYTVSEREMNTVEAALKSGLGLTKNQISQAKFRKNGICKNGIQCRIHETVRQGDIISLKLEEEQKSSGQLLPFEMKIEVLYEDEDLLVVNKPAGIAVHPSHGHYRDTLANAVTYYYQLKSQQVCIRPVGRLDLETSGVVVFAKNQTAAARLEQQKQSGLFRKEYLAVVYGKMEKPEGEITTSIGQSPDSLNKMKVDPEGKTAKTCYHVIEKNTINNSTKRQSEDNYSVLRVRLFTGRTHQIRVHMASVGHPLLGDQIYGEAYVNKRIPDLKRAALHAEKVWLVQPFTGEPLEITAPVPADMKSLIAISAFIFHG